MPPKDRPNKTNTTQITVRVPIEMADWLRDRARDHARQPGAELMLLLRPAYEADMKERARVEAVRAEVQKAQDGDPRTSRRLRRKMVDPSETLDVDLFATMLPGLE